MNWKKSTKEILVLLAWNIIFYLAFSTLTGNMYNVAGVYGLF